MLSPEAIQAIATQRGDTVVNPNPAGGGSNLSSTLDKAWQGSGEAEDTRNPVQKVLGTFLDPLVTTGVRAGQAIAAGGEKLAGVDQSKIDRQMETTYKVPFLGTKVGPVSEDTPEKVAGRALSTVGLGLGNPIAAGATLGLGNAMENNADVTHAALETVASALGGKILEYGYRAVSPWIEKGLAKYGAPLADKLTQFVPDSAKAGFDKFLAGLPKPEDIKIMPDSASKAIEGAKESLDAIPEKIASKAEDWVDHARSYLAKGNVSPQLSSSADRLGEKAAEDSAKAGRITDPKANGQPEAKTPLQLYEGYLSQEEKFKTDAHADMSLNSVGEDIGKAYDKVIAQRRAVGSKMGEELKGIGPLSLDAQKPINSFAAELKDNQNLVYDKENGELISTTRQNKMTDEDRGLLGNYYKELERLGPKPTVAELDAFTSRIPKDLDVFKRQNNITKVTNGERIVKQNINELKDLLDPEKSGNKAFQNYHDAKTVYANLSNFLDEGSRYLGAKTQGGDYVRDASVAKSSVSSVLGGGKKDWLMKLEKLTGNPLLDKTVIALQAMKDAGNAQGQSLLDLMANNGGKAGLPTSKSELLSKIFDLARKPIVGSPADQTRAFLMSLEKKP